MPNVTYMLNSNFSCQIIVQKAKFLKFDIKNTNLANLLMASRCGGYFIF